MRKYFYILGMVMGLSLTACGNDANVSDNEMVVETETETEAVEITQTQSDESAILTEDEAISLLQEQLILAYNNIYGKFTPSDVEPTLYSGDKERYAYLIPRLEVREENDQYYVIEFIRDFWVDKQTGQIMVYYNGIDPLIYEFDPMNESSLAFAG